MGEIRKQHPLPPLEAAFSAPPALSPKANRGLLAQSQCLRWG